VGPKSGARLFLENENFESFNARIDKETFDMKLKFAKEFAGGA
jgi:hypothetical protein